MAWQEWQCSPLGAPSTAIAAAAAASAPVIPCRCWLRCC
jgi:hypothetical protein